MPKYKEIKINLEIAPEVILGNVIREMIAMNVQKSIKCDSKDKEENK